MNNLTVTEYKDIRVLTTQQIAEAYGVGAKKITDNFNNNKSRYVEGKHFICLEGEELKRFKGKTENLGFARNLNKLYLWTEKGAFLHAKSLNNDVAWDVYDKLVDSYFNKQKNEIPKDYPTALRAYADEVERRQIAEQENERLQQELDYSKDWYSIKRVAAINGVDWKTFNWRRLKEKSIELGYGIKKIFDANYGEVNTYHRDAWEAAYPDYEI